MIKKIFFLGSLVLISNFFCSQTELPINSPIFNLKRKIIRTVNLLGQNVFDIKNKFVLNIYDDGSVEKVILVE